MKSEATAKSSARKKIQARQTKWNTISVATIFAAGDKARRPIHGSNTRSTASPPPCKAPQAMNFHAVPEPAKQHRQKQVAVGLPPAVTVAAERLVKIVAQPGRQRNVPTLPEFA